MKNKIFISYRRASNQWAIERLFEVLADKFGSDDVFFDRVAIEPGADWLASLDREVAQASAVVLVYSKEWAGEQPDGSRRIDRPDDMVRRELVTANRHDRPIFPVIIDDSPPPGAKQLPEGLHFILKRQFLKLVPATADFNEQAHQLTRSIAGAQPGPPWGRRFLWQVTWIALAISALVAAWHAQGGSSTFDNAFARSAMTLRKVLDIDAGNGTAAAQAAWAHDVALIEINDLDLQLLPGSMRRYDPALMSIVLNAFTQASHQGKACRPDAPVAINLDLAPDPDRFDKASFDTLNSALQRLAKCRPTVLACPRSVGLNLAPAEDMKWMARLLAATEGKLLFTHAPLDPRGLRHSAARLEPGLVLADLARAPEATAQRLHELQETGCLCPLTPEALSRCRETVPAQAWDDKGLAVPFEARAMPLSHALPSLPELASRRFVLFGEAHGTRTRYAVPGRDDGNAEAASDTLMQAYLLHGAHQHTRVRGQPWMVLLSAAFSWLVAALVLNLSATLGRYDARFSRRVPVYVAAAALMLSVPLLTLAVAAYAPSLTWLAGLCTLVGLLTLGRSLLASFEVVLYGGVRWKSLAEQVNDIRFDLDTRSAVMALTCTLLERGLMLFCVGFTLWWSWRGR